jgi:hypothetical protein
MSIMAATKSFLPILVGYVPAQFRPAMEVKAMSKCFPRTKQFLPIFAICVSACAMTGCVESSFQLAKESKLPGSMTLPPGLTRADVSVTLNFSALPGGPDAKFILKDRNGKS